MASQEKQRPLRVFMWVVPRTNSTVFTKCMSFVDKVEVWMEPYFACNMNDTVYNPEWGKGVPAMEKLRTTMKEFMEKPEYQELMKQELEKVEKYPNVWPQEQFRYAWLKDQLEVDPDDKQLVFIKDQSCAIYDHMEYLPDVPTRHVFLIRHPRNVYPSLKQIFTNNTEFTQLPWDETNLIEELPSMPIKDHFKIHRDLWKKIKNKLDPDVIVIDGHDLASRPEVILPKFFTELGIPYKESYLKWEADPELVYSSWRGTGQLIFTTSKTKATSRAVESTHFVPPKVPRGSFTADWKLTDELQECIDYSMPFYEEMYEQRLQ
ncbi:uncharacterized protein [Apostichopus japonicus]|uniref:uncharacterized protein n=1 Tax=Stichopus japonicus TaxID=307972 RepID=UPI003AB88489